MYPLNGPSWSLFFEYIGNLLYALFIRKLSTRSLARCAPFFVLRGKDEFSGFQEGKVLAREACLRGCMAGRKSSPLPEIFMVCFS